MSKLNTFTRVVTIGGGSGMPIVNKALVLAGYRDIKSIVTTFDSGGDTGRMRTDERGNLLAFSDYWRSLISLWDDGEQKAVWEEMLRYRDGRGRNFGNIFFQFMAEKSGSLSKVDSLFASLTGADLRGEVIPVCFVPLELCFETKSGKRYIGEHFLDELRMSTDMVEKMWLSSEAEANPEVLAVLKEAEVIIICPGSMYGSVLTNFLPKGVREAYCRSRGKKILLTNIMSTRNENHGFSQKEYTEVFEEYIGCRNVFDLVVMPDLTKLNKKDLSQALAFYESEHSWPIVKNGGGEQKVEVVDIADIEMVNYRLRHSEVKLTNFFLKLHW